PLIHRDHRAVGPVEDELGQVGVHPRGLSVLQRPGTSRTVRMMTPVGVGASRRDVHPTRGAGVTDAARTARGPTSDAGRGGPTWRAPGGNAARTAVLRGPRNPIREHKKAPQCGAFHSAPERTRTSTDHSVHKALNLARLPIPPQARGRPV